jgi:Uma2 family endonuclease
LSPGYERHIGLPPERRNAPRVATYADLEAVPDNLVAEILFGELVTHPRPRLRHAAIAADLIAILGPFRRGVGGPGGWLFAIEPELHIAGHVVVPDVAAWRIERAPTDFDVVGVTIVPDWVCEVLSPSTERYDKGPKRRIYAAAGLPYHWLIDPRIELLEAFQLVGGAWLVLDGVADDGLVTAAPFDALPFALDTLWPPRPIAPSATTT